MRDAVKSMLGLSWAVSLFGVQEVSRLMTPASDAAVPSMAAVDEVSRAVQDHLSGRLAERFRTGDEWQRRVVDAIFDPREIVQALDPRLMDPRRVVQTGVEMAQKSMALVRDVVSPASPSAGN